MKILELRFKNLNSLYGQWHIDFTESEYAYNGIFALTGPTGAGKSTILDAICLALYGSTPRLGRITQSNNDIMSRQTGECFAEVVFASQAGRYRCHWSHHRSRKKAEGELQSPKHEIAEADGEQKVLETKLTAVLSLVEEKTGMDFDRFTRSILLAQGGFDTFLKATVEQKSKILEQITGTKIYSEISIGVHERLREEKNLLSNLEAETRGILILSPEEESTVTEKLTLAQKEEGALATSFSDLTKAITWLKGITDLEDELGKLASEKKELERDILAFDPERTILEGALKAATLEGVYASLSELRKQQKEEQASLERETLALPALESKAKEGIETLKKAEKDTLLAKSALQEAAPTLKQVRTLDQKIDNLTATLEENTLAIAKDVASLGTTKKERETKEKKKAAEQKKLAAIETYFVEHASDKNLVTELTGIVAQIQALETKQDEVGKKEGEKKRSAKALEVAEKALETCKKKSVKLLEKQVAALSGLQAKQEALSLLLGNKPLSGYRTEKEYLLREREYLARIAALEEHRQNLAEGKPCPLCGSVEHPFAKGNVPLADKTEKMIDSLTKIITDAEALESEIQNLMKAEIAATRALTEQEKLESEALFATSHARQASESAVQGEKETKEVYAALQQGVADVLTLYGITELPEDLTLLQDSLRLRKESWQAQENAAKSIETSLGAIKGELQHLDGVIATYESALLEKQKVLKELGTSFESLKTKRYTLYGEKVADDEEEKLSQAIKTAEAWEKEEGKASAELLQTLSTAKTRIEALQTSLAKRKPDLETKESRFLEELSSLGFADEQGFLSASLTSVQRSHLAQEAKALDERQATLKTKVDDRRARLEGEKARNLTELPLSELHSLFVEKEAALQEVRDGIAEHRATIKGNSEAKQRIEKKLGNIESQKREVAKWEKLHSLIGSADGKKFRNFAQGLTFELMVGHANRQLAKMSDRYLLIRDESQPLELNVVDNYQAGEIRSTKNLSGGESFIVSLTLALGLSKMASRKVRVDSLFLDEGFGTLDETSLETALKTLSGLQQDGKLIGVISHVSAMQEMISTQITVTPSSGGKSILSGPGCSRGD